MSTTAKRPTRADLKTRVEKQERQILAAREKLAKQLRAEFRYEAARSSRLRKDVEKSYGSGDLDVTHDRVSLVAKSRYLDRNSPLYHAFVNRLVELIVGQGLDPVIDDDEAAALYRRWSQDPELRGIDDFATLQRNVLRAWIVDGDVLTLRLRSGVLQVIESDLIVSPRAFARTIEPLPDGGSIIDGVEINAERRIVGYHIAQWSPQQNYLLPNTTKRDVDTTHFLAYRIRPSQTRGVPMAHSALDRFVDLEELITSTTAAAKLASIFAALIISKEPAASLSAMADDTLSESSSDGGTRSRDAVTLDPMTIHALQPGEEITQVEPKHPGPMFEPFADKMTRFVGAPLGIPIEVGLLDNTRANFSVARIADNQAQAGAKPKRRQFVNSWADPIVRWKLRQWWRAGLLKRDPETISVSWPDPPRQLTDPTREINAAILAIENNLTSKQDWISAHGGDYERVVTRREAEVKREQSVPPAGLQGQTNVGSSRTTPPGDDPDATGEADPGDSAR